MNRAHVGTFEAVYRHREDKLRERLTLGMWCLLAACTRREAPPEPAALAAAASSADAAPPPAGPSWTASADGRVRILGRGEDTVHDHGGPPAYIGSAAYEIHNERDTPLRVSVADIEWLTSSGCQPPLHVAAHPPFAELRLGSSAAQHPSQSLTVPAKSKLDLHVGYARQEAYMVYCDRFATRVHFNVDGERIVALAEHHVTRRTALKRP